MTEPTNGKKERETGLRPEWKARQARKRVWGIIKTFIGVIFLGVLVGFGIVYKDQIMALFERKEPARVATQTPPPPPLPAAKAVEKKTEPPPPVAPPPVPEKVETAKVTPEIVPTGEEEAATKLIKDGRAALDQFKFDEALTLFNQAVVKKAGAQLRAEAKTWAHKATQFKIATKHIPVSEYAMAETSYIVKMVDGTEFNGLKVEENDETIKMQCVPRDNPAVLGSMKFPLPRNQIQPNGIIAVPLAERQKQFLELLGALESGISVQNSTDYYDVVYLSRRLNLGKECMEYLNRAYDGGPGRKPDYDVGNSFRKEVVRRAIERASLMVAGGRTEIAVQSVLNDLKKTLPDFETALNEIEAFKLKVKTTVGKDFKTTIVITDKKPAAVAMTTGPRNATKPPPAKSAKEIAREAADGEQIEFVVENSGVAGRGTAAPIVEKANAKYEEGMATYRRFRQGTNANNNQVLRAALKLLEEAVDLYGEALKKDPGNGAVLSRQTEANMIAYACRKYQTL